RPDAETVGPLTDGDPGQEAPVSRRERVDDAVVPAGEPQDLSVGGDAAHVWASAAGNPPFRDLLPSPEADHGDGPFSAVGCVEELGVAAHVEPVRAGAGVKKAHDLEPLAVD